MARENEVETEFGIGYRNPRNAAFFDRYIEGEEDPAEEENAPQKPQAPQLPGPADAITNTAAKVGTTYGIKKGIDYLMSDPSFFDSPGFMFNGGVPDFNTAYNFGNPNFLEGIPEFSTEFNPGGFSQGSQAANAAPGFLSYAGAAAGLYGLYNLGTRWGSGDRSAKGVGMSALQGAASGAAVGNVIPGVGTLIGGIVGGLYGAASSLIKTGKHEDQIRRDAIRASMQQNQFLDQDFNTELRSGEKFNLGVDGGFTYTNKDGSKGRAYDTDASNPLTHQTIGWLNPIGEIMTAGGTDKDRSDVVGQLSRAVQHGAENIEDVRQEVLNQAKRAGMSDPNQAIKRLEEIKKAGGMTDEEYNAAVYGVHTLYSGLPDQENQGQPPAAPPSNQFGDKAFIVGRDGPESAINPQLLEMIDRVRAESPHLKFAASPETGAASKALAAYRR